MVHGKGKSAQTKGPYHEQGGKWDRTVHGGYYEASAYDGSNYHESTYTPKNQPKQPWGDSAGTWPKTQRYR